MPDPFPDDDTPCGLCGGTRPAVTPRTRPDLDGVGALGCGIVAGLVIVGLIACGIAALIGSHP